MGADAGKAWWGRVKLKRRPSLHFGPPGLMYFAQRSSSQSPERHRLGGPHLLRYCLCHLALEQALRVQRSLKQLVVESVAHVARDAHPQPPRAALVHIELAQQLKELAKPPINPVDVAQVQVEAHALVLHACGACSNVELGEGAEHAD
eukprot:5379897-Prymnesium_polylepis.2